MAAMGLLCSVAVFTTASFAWFTLSTNPEIKGMQFTLGGTEVLMLSNDQAENFHYSIDISEDMNSDMSELRPISTSDGLNWYVCDYQGDGSVKAEEFFVKKWCTSPDHGKDGHTHCTDGGFLAYTDIWVKTNMAEADVRLAVPRYNIFEEEDYHPDEVSTGSYVLSYGLTEKADGDKDKQTSKGIQILQKGPETCARVGLMVFGPTKEAEESPQAEAENPHVVLNENMDLAEALKQMDTLDAEKKKALEDRSFFIYEPNADIRSELDKQDTRYRSDVYVSGLKLQTGSGAFSYKGSEGKYVQTYPIKGTGTVVSVDTDKEQTEYSGTRVEEALGDLVKAEPTIFDTTNLIAQTAAGWTKETIGEGSQAVVTTRVEQAAKENPGLLRIEAQDSAVTKLNALMMDNYITLGHFIKNEAEDSDTVLDSFYPKTIAKSNSDFTPKDIKKSNTSTDVEGQTSATSQVLFTLKKGEIRQIRLFFWIEGQDVDCWNDVAGMNFLARLEFATKEHE